MAKKKTKALDQSSNGGSKINNSPSRSWFVVLNNPAQHGYPGAPDEVCKQIVDEWVKSGQNRTAAVVYCIAPSGTPHLHMVLEGNPMRASAIKHIFPSAHIEITRGSKEQVADYIEKRGKYEEKGERVIFTVKAGEIEGNQGRRSDLAGISAMLQAGMTPHQIYSVNFEARKYDSLIRKAFFDIRRAAVPPYRKVTVHLHVGPSGSGKTHTYTQLCKRLGEDKIYMIRGDTSNGAFDEYQAEPILFLDELRDQFPYGTLLTILEGYKGQIHSRYTNAWTLWNEVYITTIFSPESLYESMVQSHRRDKDPYAQLERRITDITYHYYKAADGTYHAYTVPMGSYPGWELFEEQALAAINDPTILTTSPSPP